MTADSPAAPLRAAELDDWIDTLPYADFAGTCAALTAALRETSRQSLKPGVRLELMRCYWRPYRYLLETQVKPGELRAALRSVTAVQERIAALKRVGLEIALGAKQGAEEALGGRARGREGTTPAEGLLMAMRLLAHALVLNYHEYAPAPAGLWQELHRLYRRAEELAVLHTETADIDDEHGGRTTALGIYGQIAATALADPHHLPPGAVWEVYEQARAWTAQVRVERYHAVRNPAGLFVFDLAADHGPLAYGRFDPERAGPAIRQLDLAAFSKGVRQLGAQLEKGLRPGELRLHPATAELLLDHLQRCWGLPPKRYFPRRRRQGRGRLAAGYKAAYYFMNAEQEFAADAAPEEADGTEIDDAAYQASGTGGGAAYHSYRVNLLDEGSGGLAVRGEGKPGPNIRVGELIALDCGEASEPGWRLGVVRWLMLERGGGFRLGIQSLPRNCETVAVRPTHGAGAERPPQRGFLIVDAAMTQGLALVMPSQMHEPERQFEVQVAGKRIRLRAGTLRDRTTVFDHFSCRG